MYEGPMLLSVAASVGAYSLQRFVASTMRQNLKAENLWTTRLARMKNNPVSGRRRPAKVSRIFGGMLTGRGGGCKEKKEAPRV